MTTHPVTDKDALEALETYETLGSYRNAAAALGVAHSTVLRRVRYAKDKGLKSSIEPEVSFPVLPEDDLPVDEIIDIAERRFTKWQEHSAARRWMPIRFNTDLPVGINWFGDPHIDDDGCNWPLLRRDIAICRDTPGMYGANIGDTTNNWVGRLAALYAHQSTSRETARKLIHWLIADCGVDWKIWLMGNHDEWQYGDELLKAMAGEPVWMHNWQAQLTFIFSNKRECRVWASHNFSGHSMWNSLHGQQKAAHTKAEAHLYIAGHTHNWALHQEESASRDFVYWLARARGYKYIDSHAERMGHEPQIEGASILSIINPRAVSGAGFVQCFADLEEGADYLTHLRKKWA